MCRELRVTTFLVLAGLIMIVTGAPGVIGQEPPSIEFTHYDNNPILTPGEEGAWDSPHILLADVLYDDEMFYLFYLGGSAPEGWSVGYATSPDGLTWTRFEGNPILGPDATIAPFGYGNLAVIKSGDQWMMFLGTHSPVMQDRQGVIFKATAATVEGPWTVQEDPILEDERGWDDSEKMVQSVVETEDGYQLFYLAMSRGADSPKLGLATSPDGDVWTRYDNPDSRLPPFGQSDPVFGANEDTWDNSFVGSVSVRPGENSLEMLYFAASRDGNHIGIGYATSADGIEWTRIGLEPVLTADASLDIDEEWHTSLPAVVIVDGTYYLYYTVIEISEFTPLMVNLAVGTITRE